MKYEIEYNGSVAVLKLKNTTLDSLISSKFKAEVQKIAEKEDLSGLVIDLSPVAYIDSSGIGSMLFTHRQSKENSFPIYIVGIQNTVFKMFRISHMDDFFKYESSISEAVKKILS